MTHFLLIAASSLALAVAAMFDEHFRVPDASMIATVSLPNGSGTTVSSGIDIGATTKLAVNPGNYELVLSAPALNTTQLPDGSKITYSIVTGGNANLTVPTVIIPGVLIQTGAGGAGAAAASVTVRPPPEQLQQYIGMEATNSGSGNASAATATMGANF
ncbi:MAG TPA: hypothetical protein VGG19_12265 [Tepidisphaeraceae bacterium]|jgi:hypothetical protein